MDHHRIQERTARLGGLTQDDLAASLVALRIMHGAQLILDVTDNCDILRVKDDP